MLQSFVVQTATAFDLECDECHITLTVDLADAHWRDRLGRFASVHADHRQLVVQIPDQRAAPEKVGSLRR